MGDWRFYVQRPGSGLWLDTNAQLDTPTLTWTLSGSDSGKAMIPAGSAVPTVAEDGRNVWGKMDTVLYAEENGNLSWAGICTSATPAKEGLQLEFAGTLGWLWGVPFFTTFSSWRVNTFDVIRALIANSRGYKPGFEFVVGNGMSAFTVGDPQPPPLPKQPPRRKKETKAEWTASARYKAWQKSVEAWNTSYSNYEKFEIAWHEAPMIGEEIESLAREQGFDFRGRTAWADKGNLIPRHYFDMADDMTNRRSDIEFVDGINLAAPLDPKDSDEKFAQHVIALGAGEGPGMVRAQVGQADGRLYQAQFVQYKSIRNSERLRQLAQADYKRFSNPDPTLDTVVVWDVPGFADTSTLRVGDEVKVISQNTAPAIDAWVRVKTITRVTTSSVVTLGVEVSA